jgi:GNAT superfamily N-acetyltransferase
MLSLSEVQSDEEFDTLIPLLWRSYSNPRIPFLPLLFSAQDDAPASKKKAIELSKQMFLKSHQMDPSSHWLKVTDAETGEVVGGCRWHVHETNPYVGEKATARFVVPFSSDPTEKEFASLVLGQILNPRAERYAKAHTHLHICFVHPDHRRRGVGALLMSWGVKKADEMRVESFLEGTPMGRHLYEKFGFVVVSTEKAITDVDEPSAKWRQLEEQYLPYTW